jgi:hypothetical protein
VKKRKKKRTPIQNLLKSRTLRNSLWSVTDTAQAGKDMGVIFTSEKEGPRDMSPILFTGTLYCQTRLLKF